MSTYKSIPPGYFGSVDEACEVNKAYGPIVEQWSKNGWAYARHANGYIAQLDVVTIDGPRLSGWAYAIMSIDKPIAAQVKMIPRRMIRHYLDCVNTATPDSEIIADFSERCEKMTSATEYQKRRIIQYALAYHHHNQDYFAGLRL